MSHIYAQPHKCIKCGHEFLYSRDDGHPAPVTAEGDHPALPDCWHQFPASLCPDHTTVAWMRAGSEYDKAKAQA